MTFTLNYPAVSTYDWKPLVVSSSAKNIFRNPLSQAVTALMKWQQSNLLPRPHHNHGDDYKAGLRSRRQANNTLGQILDCLGETFTLVGLSVGLLTLFAGLSSL
jgi:hypothetical protein